MSTSDSTKNVQEKSHPASIAEEKPARFRQFVLVFVVIAASFVAYRLGRVWAEWRDVTRSRPTQQSLTPEGTAMAAAMMPLAGQWSFDDLDWGIQAKTVSRDEVAARLATFANSNGGPTADQLPDVSPEFLKLAHNLHIAPVAQAGNEVYSIDRPELKGQMVTRVVAGKAKVVSLAAAMQQDGRQWQFYELSPRPGAAKNQQQAAHLLPLPSESRRTAGRFGEDGALLLEIVELESSMNQLQSKWRNAGWEVHPTGLGDADNLSYLCTRGNETIYLWSADQPESLHSVMLVRTPEPVDTKTQQ